MKAHFHTVRLACGDVAKLRITRCDRHVAIDIFEHGEDEPLIVATLSASELRAIARAIRSLTGDGCILALTAHARCANTERR